MKLKDIIRAEKEILSTGVWGAGKMPRSAFPMSKSGEKAYRLGNREWRVVMFRALEAECRLLITVSAPLRQYQAWLGVMAGGDTKIISQFEFHPTHCGWHVHAACGSLDGVPPGIKRGPWLRRLKHGPSWSAEHRFDFSRANAFSVACRFYRLDLTGAGELL